MRKTAILICAVLLVSFVAAGCGSGTGGQNNAEVNAEIRDSIIRALATDKALNAEAVSLIASMKAGTVPVADGLNKLVTQTGTLLSLIEDMTSRVRPVNAALSKAEGTTEEYLRDRVHQIEATLNSKTGAEAEAAYAANQVSVDAKLKQARDLLIKYEPSLEKTLP